MIYTHVLIFLIACLSLPVDLAHAKGKSKMHSLSDYGRIESNEVKNEVTLSVGNADSSIKVPPLPGEPSKKMESKIITAILKITNVSQRTLHIYEPHWITTLRVKVNGKEIPYTGPVASMPPPKKSDFSDLKPAESKTLSSTVSGNFAVPTTSGTAISVEYRFRGSEPVISAQITIP